MYRDCYSFSPTELAEAIDVIAREREPAKKESMPICISILFSIKAGIKSGQGMQATVEISVEPSHKSVHGSSTVKQKGPGDLSRVLSGPLYFLYFLQEDW
jgi:hypothetical protein